MSVLCGFYDSSQHDRVYNAEEFGSLFDGLINDGVYAMYKEAMIVKPSSGMSVTVGMGRAWFNHTWTYVDAPYVVRISNPQAVIGRIDAVVLRIDKRDNYRINTIEVIEGTPSSTPEKPEVDPNPEEFVYQYPLAFVNVGPEATEIGQADIENTIGTSACPFVTAVIEYITVDDLVAQWSAQWERWADEQESGMEGWEDGFKQELNEWFEDLQYDLDGDVAMHLENRINNMSSFVIDAEGYICYEPNKVKHVYTT